MLVLLALLLIVQFAVRTAHEPAWMTNPFLRLGISLAVLVCCLTTFFAARD